MAEQIVNVQHDNALNYTLKNRKNEGEGIS